MLFLQILIEIDTKRLGNSLFGSASYSQQAKYEFVHSISSQIKGKTFLYVAMQKFCSLPTTQKASKNISVNKVDTKINYCMTYHEKLTIQYNTLKP